MTISLLVLLRIKNISDECCTENQNTHFRFNNFLLENRAYCEITWKDILEPDGPQITV